MMKSTPLLPTFLAMALGIPAASLESPFAAGTDRTGRAQAVSDAAGRVMIESPEFPRGLWLHLQDDAGQALVGIQVEYEGRPDSLITIRCIDPAGLRQETLLWTRSGGDPVRLELKSGRLADLPAGMVSVDWQIDPSIEALLEESGRLVGWTAVEALLRNQWRGLGGQVVARLDNDAIVVDLDRAEAMETLLTHLEQTHQPVPGSLADPPHFGVLVDQSSNPFLGRGVILYTALFEDAKLEASVRNWLDRRYGRIALDRRYGRIAQEVASLTSLELWGWDIQSLAGLEHAVRVTSLGIPSYHQIVDLSPLASLTNLRELKVPGNEIVDVSPLASLTRLERLNLRSNEIVDVSPLASLTNLRWLSLASNQIVDASPLASLTRLDYLTVGSRIVDVSPLASLTNLRTLGLSGNQIVDLHLLASLTHLRWLHLNSNRIVDVSPLASLTNLLLLKLRNNQISDVTPLAPLTSLQELWLESNQISDVTALASLTSLEELWLGSNQISDVGPFASLTNLEILVLYDNQIQDISSLVANPGLGEGDRLSLGSRNPLGDRALNEQIPALEARGVRVD